MSLELIEDISNTLNVLILQYINSTVTSIDPQADDKTRKAAMRWLIADLERVAPKAYTPSSWSPVEDYVTYVVNKMQVGGKV
jgi:hypothetical protein